MDSWMSGINATSSECYPYFPVPYPYPPLIIRAAYPLRIGLMADVGQTANSSLTMQRMMGHSPAVVLLTGDFTYAGVN